MPFPPSDRRAFIASLEQLAPPSRPGEPDEHRAARAALRRGLGRDEGAVAAMFPYVLPYLPPTLSRAEEDACLLVAALFGSHPKPAGQDDAADAPTEGPWGRNLGAALARLAADQGDARSTERRFVGLLSASRADLPVHLRAAVSLLRSHDIGVDWLELLDAVLSWEHADRFIQRRWAHGFWSSRDVSAAPQPQPTV